MNWPWRNPPKTPVPGPSAGSSPPSARQQVPPLLPPAPGQEPGAGAVPQFPAPAPGPPLPRPHGGKLKTVVLYADGRVATLDHRTRTWEIKAGYCPDCIPQHHWDMRELSDGR